jgi:nucleoid-associated protein YgaU
MTRETKIGMLVGLAFIIVIGILLSDHMTSTTEPQRAELTGAAADVRRGTTTPAAPVATVRTEIPPPSIPTAPLPTREELVARQQAAQAPAGPAVQNIQVGPGGAAVPAQQINIQPGTQTPTSVVIGPGAAQPPVAPAPIIITPPAQGGAAEPVAVAQGTSPQGAFDQWVQRGAAQQQPTQPEQTAPPQPARTTGVPMAAVRQYKAEAGDNLHKIAQKTMGVSTKATRDAILNANPSLKANPDKIIVGRTYLIPPASGSASTSGATVSPITPTPAPSPVVQQPSPVTPSRPGVTEVSTAEELNDAMLGKVFASNGAAPAAPATPAETAAADGYRWYTVKENDTLWGIAAEHLGAGSRLATIQELNKELLKDKVTVHPGQKLRLPAKQVASTN